MPNTDCSRSAARSEPILANTLVLAACVVLAGCAAQQRAPGQLKMGSSTAPRTVFVDANGLADMHVDNGFCKPTTGLLDNMSGVYTCRMGQVLAQALASHYRRHVAAASSVIQETTTVPAADDDRLVFRIAAIRGDAEKEGFLFFTNAIIYKWEIDLEASAGGKVIKQTTGALQVRLDNQSGRIYDGPGAFAEQGGLEDIDRIVMPFVTDAVKEYEVTHPPVLRAGPKKTTAAVSGASELSPRTEMPAPVQPEPSPRLMPERAAEFQRKAKSDFEAEHWIDAAAEFEQAYMINKDSALIFNMALCHRKAGSARRALDLYKRYLSLVPDSPKREDIEGRIRELQQHLSVVEPQAVEHYKIAIRLNAERNYGEAISEFEKALVLTQDATMLFNIGQAYRLWDRPEDAISAYRDYVRRTPAARNRAVVQKTIAYLERVVDDRHLGLPPQQSVEPILGDQEILPPAASHPGAVPEF